MVDLKAKPFNLTDTQVKWVEETISSMTVEQKIGQLFVHLTGSVEDEDVKDDVVSTNLGGIRFNPRSKEEMWEMNYNFQKHSKIPVLSAVNVECGGNGASSDGTFVGSEMKIAATGDSNQAYRLGQICGRETKATGSTWAFAPIVDLVNNWHNPGIGTRGFGKNPDMVLDFSKQYFKGMQESGIACAMKHFPGDGNDERDPHICTSINDLSCEQWDKTYGKVFKGMIDDGIQSLMPGHIMLPSYQKHFSPNTREQDLLPATLSKEILTDLLRGKLGFNGLIVTDASHMVGLSGRAKRRDLVPGAIVAGCDMFLFFNDIEEDLKYMTEAYEDGRLTEQRLHDALSRILGLKAHVGLDTFTLDKFPAKEGLSIIGCEAHKKVALEIADKAITLVKQVGENIFPISPKNHKRVLLVQVGPTPNASLAMAGMAADSTKLDTQIKEGFEKNGFAVDIYVDPMAKAMEMMRHMTPEQLKEMQKNALKKCQGNKGAYGNKQSVAALTGNYDLVFCYANVSGTMRAVQRLEWAISKGGWDNPWYVNELPVIFASFNCAFHLADVPQIKNYINCYDSHAITVEALINKLIGKTKFTGVSPVDAFCGLRDTHF